MVKFSSVWVTFFFMTLAYAAELVTIPAGKIEAMWLSPISKKSKSSQVVVSVKPFKMMKYAVTRNEFDEFLKRQSMWQKANVSQLLGDENYLSDLDKTSGRAPITNVSWFAARAYCSDSGMRLPTVNEWEYAAAASEKKYNANRDAAFLNRILNWYGEPKGERLLDVGSIYKNIYGVYDMHGLIWEWVEDFNSTFVTGESREDGTLNKAMFCGSGGMSLTDKENYAAFMRFAFRSALKGRVALWNLGFRCVK